jgi:hypothetical protein
MGDSLAKISTSPNVADTCMVVMALYRAGSTPKAGPYKDNIIKAIDFVCDQIQRSDSKDLYITDLKGTRTQTKLGSYIDTFMAAQMLAEMKNQMPDDASIAKVGDSLARVIKKIEINQKDNGQWVSDGGWAPALAQFQCSKALNVAVQNGAQVDEKVRIKAEGYARAEFANSSSSGRASEGSAGVPLYGTGGQVAAMQASANSNHQMKEHLEEVAASPTTSPALALDAKEQLRRIADNDKDLAAAQDVVINQMQDKRFIAGFGSNGGEEFLSYLNIGESLILKGGDAWEKWDRSITENLNNFQNADGSWSGQHCITGRTFCTAAALQVLTIDRAPQSASPKIQQAAK